MIVNVKATNFPILGHIYVSPTKYDLNMRHNLQYIALRYKSGNDQRYQLGPIMIMLLYDNLSCAVCETSMIDRCDLYNNSSSVSMTVKYKCKPTYCTRVTIATPPQVGPA